MLIEQKEGKNGSALISEVKGVAEELDPWMVSSTNTPILDEFPESLTPA